MNPGEVYITADGDSAFKVLSIFKDRPYGVYLGWEKNIDESKWYTQYPLHNVSVKRDKDGKPIILTEFDDYFPFFIDGRMRYYLNLSKIKL